MDEECFIEDPLKETKWENLSFTKYYNDMSDDERVELKEYLESINAPFGSDLNDESDPEGNYTTWRDIVSMTEKELNEMNTEILSAETIIEHSAINETTEVDSSTENNSDSYDIDLIDLIDTPLLEYIIDEFNKLPSSEIKQTIGEFIKQLIKYFFTEVCPVDGTKHIDLDHSVASFIVTYDEALKKVYSIIEQHDCVEESVTESY